MYTYYIYNINNIVFSIFLNWHNIIYIIDGKYWHINHLILCDTFKISEFASEKIPLNTVEREPVRLESSILTRAKRATNRNNVATAKLI